MKIALLIVSDRVFNNEKIDETIPLFEKYFFNKKYNWFYNVVPDSKYAIKEAIYSIIKEKNVDLLLTSGGTGFASRDVTPEATKEVIEREANSIVEFIRSQTGINNKNVYLSRAICGILSNTIILNLPGSPNGALESFKVAEDILLHAILILKDNIKDCNKI